MVLKAIDDLGRLDLLVNNAGTPGTRRRITPPELELITEDLWSQLLETNLLGVFRCAKAAAPALKAAHGAIVNTASIAGLGRAGSSLAYSATKAGVVSLTQNLARALAPEVRVNAIAPGAVDSSWMVEWTNEERAAVDRTCGVETALPAGGPGRGDPVPGLRRGHGDRADGHGRWRAYVVISPAPDWIAQQLHAIWSGACGTVCQKMGSWPKKMRAPLRSSASRRSSEASIASRS